MKKETSVSEKKVARKAPRKANKSFIVPLTFDKGIKFNFRLSIVKIKRLFLKEKRHYLALSFLAIVLVSSSMFVYKNYFAKGATYGWLQTDWSGGASATTATHTNNQENWTYYSSKTANISTADGVLTQTSASPDVWLETLDADFTDHGSTTATTYISGGKIYPKKSAGATCSVASECLGTCALGTCDSPSNWLTGACSGIYVYYVDVSGTKQWKTSQTSCTSPQCLSSNLVSDNTVDFSLYPARNACKSLGGRLPTSSELACINTNRASYGNNFQANYYWSSAEYSTTRAWFVYFYDGSSNYSYKDSSSFVRCVRGQ